MTTLDDVLRFWFEDSTLKDWFAKSEACDEKIRTEFGEAYDTAAEGDFSKWRVTASGCLALGILLDQFPPQHVPQQLEGLRYRLAGKGVATHALERNFDVEDGLTDNHRCFLYLPFEHSEAIEDQLLSLRLFRERTQDERYVDYAERHHRVIERFGRFPHRNTVMGRESTAEEREFLRQNKTGF